MCRQRFQVDSPGQANLSTFCFCCSIKKTDSFVFCNSISQLGVHVQKVSMLSLR